MRTCEKRPPAVCQATAPRQAQQTVPSFAGNQAMLAMLGIQDQSGDTRFSEKMRARFAPKPMPQAERSQPMALSPEVLQKAEERYQMPLAGLKAYEDTGLLDSGYNGYAQGNEIHIDGSLAPEKREEVLMHEIGHVVQRGSGRAQGSGLLDNPALEQQADQGFSAPQSFAMPTSSTGPVMGDFNSDRQQFRAWKAAIRANQQNQLNLPPLPTRRQRHLFRQRNRVYESVANGQVGSIYYGSGNRRFGQFGLRRHGSRLRLLHNHGPQASAIRRVERYVIQGGQRVPIDPHNLQPTANLPMSEHFYNARNQRIGRHPSRGSAQRNQAVDNLRPKDHKKLLQAVMFAQHIAMQNPNANGRPRRRNADQANQFLYAYMQSHPRLANIPLNMGNAQGAWQFQPNANYQNPVVSNITRVLKQLRGK